MLFLTTLLVDLRVGSKRVAIDGPSNNDMSYFEQGFLSHISDHYSLSLPRYGGLSFDFEASCNH